MKKLLILAFTLALSILCLFSCASNVTIYSKSEEIKPSVIIADFATSAETSAYNRVCSAVQDVLGRSGFYNKTDVYLEAASEIIVGNSTNRTATAKALDLLNASYVDDGDTAAYAIYCYNGSIAIVASSDFALPIAVEYFIENYLTGETLSVNSNLVDLKTFSITAYNAALDAELSALSDANFAARWDEATAKLPPDAVDALKRLYSFYGTDWATWIYNLYDPETGCFYYANSARDYDGFFVDAESTCQALDILYHMGLFEDLGNSWAKAIPASMREKCLAYIQAMQDPEDGYFYHPQWGNEIGDARKGRDLSQCITLIQRMGGTPLYDTALDNIGDVGPVSSIISSFMETDTHKSTVETVVDDRFKSEEGMKAYLDGLVRQHTNSKGIFDSYTFGHTLSSQTQQVVAAGLGKFVCDYIDDLQDPETGFYQKLDPDNAQAGYQAASGVIKIAAFYTSVNGAIKYGDKMLDTIFDIITDDTRTTQITYVFNPWGALGAAVSSIRNSIRTAIAAGEEPMYSETWLMQRIYTRLPALINATIEKLTPYQHADGSFSYKDDGNSLTNNQGVIASLGYYEGDVNGTACAMHYILNSLFGIIDIDPVPMLKYSDYMAFRDTVESAGSVVKQEVPLPELLDFEDFDGADLPSRVTHGASAEGDSVEVIDAIQRNGEEGKVLAITKQNTHFTTYIEAKSSHQKLACFTFSFDLYVDSADPAAIYQIFFTNTNQNNWYAYMLEISTSGGAVYINDNVSNGSNKKNSPNDLEITEKVDTWFNLKIEYYVLEEEETGKTIAKIKIYKNGVCVKISDNYFVNSIQSIAGYQEYLNDATGTVEKPAALSYINRVDFFTRVTPKSKIRLDNIDCIPSASAIFSDADVVPGAGLMVEPDEIVNDTIDFEDGALDPELFVGTDGFFSVETKATTDNADNKAYKLTSTAGRQQTANIGVQSGLIKPSVFTFEADICVDDVVLPENSDGGLYQIIFNDVSTSVFMLSLNVSGGKVTLATWNSTQVAAPVVNLGVSETVGSWFNLKVEYYPVSETEAHIVAYVNGIKAGESDAYYNKASGAAAGTKINTVVIYDRVAPSSSLYIDNIKFSYDATKTYTPAE